MDSRLYFPAFIHAPVPLNTQAFDVDAFTAQDHLYPTFPTPSELMVDLASTTQPMNNPLDDLSFMQVAQMNDMRIALGMGIGDLQQRIDAPGHIVPGHDLLHHGTVESARRVRRRASMSTVSTTHGSTFVPTDPDTISSHEKKRHYLECIEQYIQFLHEQFDLLGERPPEMERVASYRGLSSRSIRTLLVHMEHNTRKLTERTRGEEQRFVSLRNELQ